MQQRLHYPYEGLNEVGKKGLVYFCAECQCILKVRRNLEPMDGVEEVLESRCHGCGSALGTSMRCKSSSVLDEWSQIASSNNTAYGSSSKQGLLRPAPAFRGFSFEFPPLDRLVGQLEPGWTAVLTGRYAGMAAELLCFRAQLPKRHGGLDSTVVFVDGGNCSDPYLFSSYAKQYGIDPRKALGRVVTSRAFTVYQLANLVRKELPRVIDHYDSKMVVVSDVLSMFTDPSVHFREAERVVEVIKGGIREIQRRKDVFLLVTLTTRTSYDQLIMGCADILVNIDSANSRVMAMLLKHPLKEPRLSEFREQDLLLPVSRGREAVKYG